MESDKNIEQELAELIADPEMVSPQHTAVLNELLLKYPFYQPLHLLLAKAGQSSDKPGKLTKAALYTNGQALHRFLFERKNRLAAKQSISTDFIEEVTPDSGPSAIVEEIPVVTDEQETISDEQETFEEISEDILVFPVDAETNHEQETQGVILQNADGPTEIETVDFTESEQKPAHREESWLESHQENAEDETVFEEIVEVDFSTYRPFKNSANADDALLPEDHTTDTTAKSEDTKDTDEKHSLKGDFVFESIVSSDFFAFEDKFSTVENTEQETQHTVADPPYIEEHNDAAATEIENHSVSNYHDDNLPYTFLWWLAKTRKEHQSTFQPYAIPKRGGGQELQQQYVEHIFHIQSHLNGSDEILEDADTPKPISRDFQIIDSFIKNDPQIHPPNAEQIDNENKAKKSAEDQNDLVSETLANIYIEQMLYDKAIDTYEKLSLKFPEKSRYFADLIQSLEKKI